MAAVHVRIVTPITTAEFRRPADFTAYENPTLQISQVSVTTGPASIECGFESTLSEPGTIARVMEAERDGVDAVVIDCMADPGLTAAREAVSIPVIGPSQTAMHMAALLGHSFSFLSVLPSMRVPIENLAAIYGLTTKLASVRPVNIPVLDLEKDIVWTRARLIEVAERAIVEDGAHALIFGCTGLLGSADAVREGLAKRGHDVPVIDPIPTALRLAGLLVLGGLRHSKLSSPPPPKKELVGYPEINHLAKNIAAE
ncbi:MAG: aspartate/glutamate racemase family protein [Alphaproteobacteria bacterium]